MVLQTPGGDPCRLVNKLGRLKGTGQTAEWDVRIPLEGKEPPPQCGCAPCAKARRPWR
jgi:hypothetical protein